MEKINLDDVSLNMDAIEFQHAGHLLVDYITTFLQELPGKKVTTGAKPKDIQKILGNNSLPQTGGNTIDLLEETSKMLFDHSLFNGHPKFWGYITSSGAPIGALADFLAASVNANVGAFALSPMATEIEKQTIQWLAELIGYNKDCGGLFVSGGNMANFLGFLAGRRNKIDGDIRKNGLPEITIDPSQNSTGYKEKRRYTIYCAKGTHTWIHKATDLFGHGTDSIRWIDCLPDQQMNISHLKQIIKEDKQFGHKPFLVIGNAGSVSTGIIDPLTEIAAFCKSENLWFHVDGAYGAPAACLPELAENFKGLSLADSIALDPHKWLYSPLEAGCILVRDPRHLHDAFSFTPEYYNFGGNGKDAPMNFHEYGMQNSRGFRALKVWMSLKQVGRNGLTQMIRKNIELAKLLFQLAEDNDRLEAISQNLSITTFRYVPKNETNQDLNQLNETLLNRLQAGGEVFLSNAIINGNYCLRVCIVNFRTSDSDIRELVQIVLREGEKLYNEMVLTTGEKHP